MYGIMRLLLGQEGGDDNCGAEVGGKELERIGR